MEAEGVTYTSSRMGQEIYEVSRRHCQPIMGGMERAIAYMERRDGMWCYRFLSAQWYTK
jgi:hypothetical protein